MRISDWSSDVCSSDLSTQRSAAAAQCAARRDRRFSGRDRSAHARRRQSVHAGMLRPHGGDAHPDRKSTRLNSSHSCASRMQSSALKQKTTMFAISHETPTNTNYLSTYNSYTHIITHFIHTQITTT